MPDVPVVVIRHDVNAQNRARLEAAAPAADLRIVSTADELARHAPEAEVIGGDIGREVLARATNLAWLHSWAAGPRVYPELAASPVTMTSSKSNGAVPLAEHVLLLMLMLNRDALRWVRAQQERTWSRHTHGELAGLTCGVIGLGFSGLDVARKAKAFHMRVLGLRRTDAPAGPDVDEVYTRDRLHELLAASDFVVMTAPLTAETAGMLGAAEFAAMKPTAYYVCISRGGIADDAALLAALESGGIAGAGIDAHGEEPLPADSPFWTAPNTIVTPHNGATTPQTRQRGLDIFIENLRRYCAGEELVNLVDKQAGY